MINANEFIVRNGRVVRDDIGMFDLVTDYAVVETNNGYQFTLPVVRRMTNKEIKQTLVKGLIGAIIMYITLVLIIGLAPTSLL